MNFRPPGALLAKHLYIFQSKEKFDVKSISDSLKLTLFSFKSFYYEDNNTFYNIFIFNEQTSNRAITDGHESLILGYYEKINLSKNIEKNQQHVFCCCKTVINFRLSLIKEITSHLCSGGYKIKQTYDFFLVYFNREDDYISFKLLVEKVLFKDGNFDLKSLAPLQIREDSFAVIIKSIFNFESPEKFQTIIAGIVYPKIKYLTEDKRRIKCRKQPDGEEFKCIINVKTEADAKKIKKLLTDPKYNFSIDIRDDFFFTFQPVLSYKDIINTERDIPVHKNVTFLVDSSYDAEKIKEEFFVKHSFDYDRIVDDIAFINIEGEHRVTICFKYEKDCLNFYKKFIPPQNTSLTFIPPQDPKSFFIPPQNPKKKIIPPQNPSLTFVPPQNPSSVYINSLRFVDQTIHVVNLAYDKLNDKKTIKDIFYISDYNDSKIKLIQTKNYYPIVDIEFQTIDMADNAVSCLDSSIGRSLSNQLPFHYSFDPVNELINRKHLFHNINENNTIDVLFNGKRNSTKLPTFEKILNYCLYYGKIAYVSTPGTINGFTVKFSSEYEMNEAFSGIKKFNNFDVKVQIHGKSTISKTSSGGYNFWDDETTPGPSSDSPISTPNNFWD